MNHNYEQEQKLIIVTVIWREQRKKSITTSIVHRHHHHYNHHHHHHHHHHHYHHHHSPSSLVIIDNNNINNNNIPGPPAFCTPTTAARVHISPYEAKGNLYFTYSSFSIANARPLFAGSLLYVCVVYVNMCVCGFQGEKIIIMIIKKLIKKKSNMIFLNDVCI